MFVNWKLLSVFAVMVAMTPMSVLAEPVGRITGVGGIFFQSTDPKALTAWYRDVLGIRVEDWGGVILSYDAPEHPPVLTMNVFKDRLVASCKPGRQARMILTRYALCEREGGLARRRWRRGDRQGSRGPLATPDKHAC